MYMDVCLLVKSRGLYLCFHYRGQCPYASPCPMSCFKPLVLVGLQGNLMFVKCLSTCDGGVIFESPLEPQAINANAKHSRIRGCASLSWEHNQEPFYLLKSVPRNSTELQISIWSCSFVFDISIFWTPIKKSMPDQDTPSKGRDFEPK